MSLALAHSETFPVEDERDRRIRQLRRLLEASRLRNGELREQVRELTESGLSRSGLLVQIDLLTTDLVETQRQLRIARGRG